MPREINYGDWDALEAVATEYQTVIDETGKYGIDGAKHKARAEGIDLIQVYRIMHLIKTVTRGEFYTHSQIEFRTWVRLSQIDDPDERAFYLDRVAREGWSVRELERTIQDVRRIRPLLKQMKKFIVKRRSSDSGTAG